MLTQLHELNDRWFQAWQEKDAATVERLMAEDYVYIAPSGIVLDRQRGAPRCDALGETRGRMATRVGAVLLR